jgi:hypothetical protein
MLHLNLISPALSDIGKLTGKVDHHYSDFDGFCYSRMIMKHCSQLARDEYWQLSVEEWERIYRNCFQVESHFKVCVLFCYKANF